MSRIAVVAASGSFRASNGVLAALTALTAARSSTSSGSSSARLFSGSPIRQDDDTIERAPSHFNNAARPSAPSGRTSSVIDEVPAAAAGGPGAAGVAGLVELVAAAFSGDGRRATEAVKDMTGRYEVTVSAKARPPHTTAQDWPRGSLATAASSAEDDALAAAAVNVRRFGGTLPSASPPRGPPDLDEAAAAPDDLADGPSLSVVIKKFS